LSPRWAIIVLTAATLALAGCGRKGPLELPPTGNPQTPNSQSSNSSTSAPSAAVTGDTETDQASKPSVFNPSYGSDGAPVAGRGPKRPFILDPLLNSN
jgi:predicted small lipoprotein YifL